MLMKVLSRIEIEKLQREAATIHRIVDFVEGAEVGKDIMKDSRNAIMKELEDSELINKGLLDEVEARMLADNPMYVNEIVRWNSVNELVAKGIDEWKAIEIVDNADVKRGVAGYSNDNAKANALEGIAKRKAKHTANRLKEVEQFGEASATLPSGMTEIGYRNATQQTMRYRISDPYTQNIELKAGDLETLARINESCEPATISTAIHSGAIVMAPTPGKSVDKPVAIKRAVYVELKPDHNVGMSGY